MEENIRQENNTRLLLSILIPFSFGYLLTCVFRSVNAIQASFLEHNFNLSAKDVGLLTSVYFLSFAISQIPLGILLDRYGPRIVQTVFFCIATIGIIIFATAEGLASLTLGRFILGIGVSGGLMCALKANAKWFPDKIPLMNGTILAFGGAGALFATVPTQILINAIGWRAFNVFLSAATLTCALLVFLLAPQEKEVARNEKLSQQFLEILNVTQDSFFWKVVPVTMIVLGFFMSMQGLWTTSWLIHVNKFSFTQAGFCLSGIAIAFSIGLFGMGYVGNLLKNNLSSLLRFIKFGFFITLLLETLIVLKLDMSPYISWFFYALFAQIGTLSYSLLMMHFHNKYAGRAITALNLGIFLSAFAIQYIVGWIIHYTSTNLNLSTALAYQATFASFLVLQYITLIWFLFTRTPTKKLILPH